MHAGRGFPDPIVEMFQLPLRRRGFYVNIAIIL